MDDALNCGIKATLHLLEASDMMSGAVPGCRSGQFEQNVQ
jgi:hypothetical protein